jgi:hypothetical protein
MYIIVFYVIVVSYEYTLGVTKFEPTQWVNPTWFEPDPIQNDSKINWLDMD